MASTAQNLDPITASMFHGWEADFFELNEDQYDLEQYWRKELAAQDFIESRDLFIVNGLECKVLSYHDGICQIEFSDGTRAYCQPTDLSAPEVA